MEDPAVLKSSNIRMLFTDVDGVWTDGKLYYSESGHEHMKAFHVRDGMAVKLSQAAGIPVVLLSSKPSGVLRRRAAELGVQHCFEGIPNKLEVAVSVAGQSGLSLKQCAMVGDDLVDLPLIRQVGFSATVADAPTYIRESVDFVTELPGGRGAFREVVECILRTQGVWEQVISRFGGSE